VFAEIGFGGADRAAALGDPEPGACAHAYGGANLYG
jgi:hypothetical protein